MPTVQAFVLTLLQTLVTALIVAIIARSLLSFVVRDWRNPLSRFLYDITEPVLAPVRRVLPVAMGGLDFSPFLVIMGLWLLLDVVQRLNP